MLRQSRKNNLLASRILNTLFFLVIYCTDFKAFLHNHLYYLIWKGSLLLSSRATACATGGLKHVDMLSLSPLEAPQTLWALCFSSADLCLNLCHSKPALLCFVLRVAFTKKSICFTKVIFYHLVNTFPMSSLGNILYLSLYINP